MKIRSLGDVYRTPVGEGAGAGERTGKTAKMATEKLRLETYLRAIESPSNWSDLIRPEISQIIAMHGYCTMSYKLKKVEMIDMLRELDFISPERSTLGDSSLSAGVDLSMEEMKRDLASLDWGECEVQSVQSVCSSTPPPEKMHGCSGLLALCAVASKSNKRGRVERIETESRKKIAAGEAAPAPPRRWF